MGIEEKHHATKPKRLRSGGAEVETGTPDGARFPSDGASLPVPAQDDGGGIDIVLVPMRWDADKSGRLPDTSPEQIERMRSALRAMYPVREVRITVHEPVAWSRGLLPSGSADFGAMISSLRFLRTRDEVPSSHYYYGMVAPTEYFDGMPRAGERLRAAALAALHGGFDAVVDAAGDAGDHGHGAGEVGE